MQELKQLIERREYGEAWQRLMELTRSTRNYSEFAKLARLHQRLKNQSPRTDAKSIRIALIGGATTDYIVDALELALAPKNLSATIFQSNYNAIASEMLVADSEALRFKPDVAVLVNTPANIHQMPNAGDSRRRVGELVDEVCEYWLGLCQKFREQHKCEIIINNFHQLPLRSLGNLSAKTPWDADNFLKRVNIELGDRAPEYVHINDVESLAAQHGIDRWIDLRYWYHAKQPVSFESLPAYACNTASLIGALFGRTKKCLVLDLDNTLWGGVVGDEGADGIKIGEGEPVGEAFKAFQEYILQLKQRGILLTVCSKNDLENALEPFRVRSEMILQRDDFVAFKANWDPKPENIRQIASELNIGLDSLVFVDDNPAERAHVRLRLPEVNVVELTDDPADYPQLVNDTGHFEITSISDEDRQRTQQYQENAERAVLKESVSDYASYVASLEQRAFIRPIEPINVARVTQLINKSNQFNLTTRRYTTEQVTALMQNPLAVTATVSLKDRFGDNGLISVFASHIDAHEMFIDLWLMSCRVLKREVEQCLLNYVMEAAKQRGVQQLHGVYIPTKKNSMVSGHYSSMGFESIGEDEIGATHWKLNVDEYRPFNVSIVLDKELVEH